VPQDTAQDTAYVALGSNVGDRGRHLSNAIARITAIAGVSKLRASSVEETAPLGPVEQGAYFNQMVAFETTLTPRELLGELHVIEQAGGRARTVKWGPRTIDLDIVMFREATCHDPDLVVPHPQIQHRDFWQRELAELHAPGYTDPPTRPLSPQRPHP
jgi:2-amino-4-hydroxy-6-hydroxymethyldihydropteridine diphosphokinase